MADINSEFFEPYANGKKRHKNYARTVDIYHEITFHFDGYFQRPWKALSGGHKEAHMVNPYFSRLIDQRRPSESDAILKYRRLQYLPITKSPCQAVVNSLKKIVKSPDWHIDYSKCEYPKSLPEDLTLEQYAEKNYPKDDSIENWSYKNLVRWMLIDPNALVVVMPLSWDIENNEFPRPYAHIVKCMDVYDYKEGELAVFLSPYESSYKTKDGTNRSGKIIMTVDKLSYYEYKQVDEDKYDLVEHPHNIGEMPCWLMGGMTVNPDFQQPFYESFIQGMLPGLHAAAMDSSDLSAEKVQNLFSTPWYIQSQSCSSCQGTGKVLALGKQTVCPACEGRGGLPPSPYRSFEINLNNSLSTEKNVPTPPAGFIEKTTVEMVKLMREEISVEIYQALSAINMQFLDKTPLVQSGLAKEVDKDELNNFVYSIAYHIVEEVVKPIYYFINELRYMTAIPNKEERKKMLPSIPVPESFDFLTNKDAEDNLIKVAGSDVSEEIKDLCEMEYIHSKYQDNAEVRGKLIAIHDHDPLPAFSVESVQLLLNAGLITKEDAVLHVYIKTFVCQLLNENTEFLQLTYEEQQEILLQMATEKINELDPTAQIKRIVDDLEKKETDPNPVDLKLAQQTPGQKPRKKLRDNLLNA